MLILKNLSLKKYYLQSVKESNFLLILSIILTAQIDDATRRHPIPLPDPIVTEINSTDTDDSGPTNLPSKVSKDVLNFCGGKSC